jgi:hypothetical protein
VEVFRAGDRLVGVEYDTVETRDALRATCGRWLPDQDDVGAQDVPAAYGVRTAKVGFRRRKVGIVHHGAPIRHRLDTPREAVVVMEGILGDVARERSPGAVSVDARCFVRDGRAVLVDVPLSRDVDERPLRAEGFEEVPAWRPMVDPDALTVDVAGRTRALAGVAVVGRPVGEPDALRSHVWHLAEGDLLAWAELVDGLGDGLVSDADDVLDACRRLLR